MWCIQHDKLSWFNIALLMTIYLIRGRFLNSYFHSFYKIHYMWHMYNELSDFGNHQSIICHPNWLYLHWGIIDAAAQTKIYRTCIGPCCRRDIWHIKSKQILQPPKYLIIIVNKITYSDNRITKSRITKVACLWIYILSWVLTNFPTSLCGPSWILHEQRSLHSLIQWLWENISL